MEHNIETLTKDEAIELLWRSGNITDYKLDDLQKKVVRAYRESDIGKEIVAVMPRQGGKSYTFAGLAIEECLRRPGIVVLYVGPTLKMAKRICRNNFNEILSDCPFELRPKYKTQESEYLFENGSRVILAGFNAGEVDSIRGIKAHVVFMDECGFMDSAEFEYGVSSSIYATMNYTRGTLLMCSTLPKSAAHPYWKRVLNAKLEGRLIEGSIYDCPRYTKEDIEKFAERIGGVDSVDFRREYLNDLITDEDSAVFPEATKTKMNLIVKEVNRPQCFDAYTSMDIGFRDYTAILFGYYDFLRNTVVIEDEVIIKGNQVTTNSIAEAHKTKEFQLWGHKKPYLRVSDNNNLILLNELSMEPYNLSIMATAKDNREAAINKVRLLLQKEQLIIHPRCNVLIQHLQHATWNSKRSDFDRDSMNGHFDAAVSLVYMCRNIQYNKNPFPDDFHMVSEMFYTGGASPKYDKPKDDFQSHIKNLFNPFRKRER